MNAETMDIETLPDLEGESPRRILEWTFDRFGDRAALSTAFGASGVALMHLASQVNPGARVFFVDTGFHFAETLEMIDRIQAAMPVTIQVIEPVITIAEQARRHGDALYVINPDQCCAIRKVEPTRRMLSGLDGWITALRRDQGKSRAATPVLDRRVVDGRTLVKVNPLVTWDRKDVWRHIFTHDLPYNPLHDQNYPSIGCAPCTRPALDAADERSGRWVGHQKTECGLHTSI